MAETIDAFLSAHAKAVLWIGIIILWITVGAFAHKANKFIKKKMIEQLKEDLREIQKENQDFRQASKPLTQQSFEEWKAEKRKQDQGGFVDLDAVIRLPWRRTA